VHANREISGWVVEKDPSVNLVKCAREKLLTMFTESEVDTYVNSVCFDSQSDLKLRANYNNYEEYIVPYLTVVECKNTTDITCATSEEIQEFIRSTQIILTVAETKAFENLYEDQASYYKNGEYFPLKIIVE
jgi:hypothetical protein